MPTKICKDCKQTKDTSKFYPCKANPDGIMGKCISCKNAQSAATYQNRKAYYGQKHQEWNSQNLEWYRNRDRQPAYRKKKRIRDNIRAKERRLTDINFKIKKNLRCRIYDALKFNRKSQHTMTLLGCSIEEFKKHLMTQFRPGMTWENYGFGNEKWHIDHIRPCDSFDLSNPQQQKQCFHYTNLQPLWQPDNIKKSNQIQSYPKSA